MRHWTALALLYGIVSLAGGCASAPSHFYTLDPVAPAAPGPLAPGAVVVVGPVAVPEVVDRPQMVLRTGPNRMTLDELNRWASSLQDEIAHAVAQNLTARLGTSNVTVSAQGVKPDGALRVAIQIQRFESAPGEAVRLDALWNVRRSGEDTVRTGRTTVSEPAQASTLDALVAAHSRALGRLSDDIAHAIRSIEVPRR